VDYQSRSSSAIGDGHTEGRSIGEILNDMASALQEIVRSEIRLARIEMTQTARGMRASAVMLLSGGILAVFALGFLFLAAMFALEIALPNWLSALIVAVLLFASGGMALATGRQRLRTVRPPLDTMQTIKEDLKWTNEQARS